MRFPLSERKCHCSLSEPGYSGLLLLQLSRSKPVMGQSLPEVNSILDNFGGHFNAGVENLSRKLS